ncbi:MAG: hypothetical protein IJ449_10780 [Clostridia bacterium]|nr:hypothetical protein [Clostridia bacterium]
MQSIRTLITEFAYPHLDYLLSLVDRDGDAAALGGFPCMADNGGTVIGMLIRAAADAYLRAPGEETRARLCRFFSRITEDSPLHTWGKLSVLTTLRMLQNAGESDILSPKTMELLCRRTDYDDFFDRETLSLKNGLPTNYYHVAHSCACLREELGFDTALYSGKIAEKLLEVICGTDSGGWMDERPPRGRFDSYSIGMNRSMVGMYRSLGMEVPPELWARCRESAYIHFANRNRCGTGISYGRSLSVYGDTESMTEILFAMRNGLLDKADIPEAVAYLIHIAEKLIRFWYRPDGKWFDIWTGGRATESYRGPHRVLEVNLEITTRLVSLLHDAVALGFADTIPENDIAPVAGWECRETVFQKEPGKMRALYVLRHGEHSFMFPFVGAAGTSYFPFPSEAYTAEAPVEQYHPFLVPVLTTEDGREVMPIWYFDDVKMEQTGDTVSITATGNCCETDRVYNLEKMRGETDIRFVTRYVFRDNTVNVCFTFEKEYDAEILYAGIRDCVTFYGFSEETVSDISDDETFHTPHGAETFCKTAHGFGRKFGYTLTL